MGADVNPEDAVDLGREALKACMLVGGPIVVLGLVVGLVVGVLQAMTQVQDQTVSFVPKILVMILGIGIALPWLSDKMVDYTKSAFETPMIHMSHPVGDFDGQPSWQRPLDFPLHRTTHAEDDLGNDDRLASPLPEASRSSMPRLSQRYSMPTMKPKATSSMPMLRPAGKTPFAPTAPRMAEKTDPDF